MNVTKRMDRLAAAGAMTLAAGGFIGGGPALAQQAPLATAQAQAPAAEPPTPTGTPQAPAPASPPAAWADGIKFNAQIEGGVSATPLGESGSNENYGQLFTDHNNQFQLNQVLLTVQRALDPKNPDFDVGFKLQGMYGSDARYTHFLGELDKTIGERYQLDIVEANVQFHLPILTEGGLDLKVGQYPTPLGFEVIDPSANPFYSHSYIFNFGIPLKHTGGYGTLHVSDTLDLWGGVDTGVNTSFGRGAGDNNGAAGFIAGFGLNNLMDGKLTFLILSHIGPENSSLVVPQAGNHYRYLTDAIITYKPTDTWTLTTELNWARDDYFKADAGGVAQYASYTLNDTVTLNGRIELFRDDNGFFVAEFPGNLDFVNAERGDPARVLGVGQATYTEFTLGLTWKPSGLPDPIAGLIIRPEARVDYALTNQFKEYNGFRNRVGFTLASDVILQF